jgi:hypothetical protein
LDHDLADADPAAHPRTKIGVQESADLGESLRLGWIPASSFACCHRLLEATEWIALAFGSGSAFLQTPD